MELRYPSSVEHVIEPYFPPGYRPSGEPSDAVIELLGPGRQNPVFRLYQDDVITTSAADLEVALNALDAQIRAVVGLLAPNHVFVHAGCVEVDGRALILPGRSFTGKSTLVAALLRAGANYLSDEFAVIDGDGLIHGYPRLISLRRSTDGPARDLEAGAFGAKVGTSPVRCALVAAIEYRPDGGFAVEPMMPGAASLALVEHTVPARTRPQESLQAIARVTASAAAVRGTRGDAQQAARGLLQMLSGGA